MRFRRSPPARPRPRPRPRPTGKSNCDPHRVTIVPLVPPRSYHRNRTFLYSVRKPLLRHETRSRTRSFFPSLTFFRLSLSLAVCSALSHRLPSVSFVLFFSPRRFCRPPCFSLTSIAFCQPTSYFYYPLSLSTCCVSKLMFFLIISFLFVHVPHLPLFNSFSVFHH